MIPKAETLLIEDFDVAIQSSKTYALNVTKNRIINKTDDIDAVKQAIYLILSTERYRYIIYSWNYGIELEDLFGGERYYVIPQLEKRITEALMQDDRIKSVSNFKFNINKNIYHITFTVETIFGNIDITKELTI